MLENNTGKNNLSSRQIIERQYFCSFCWRELPNNSIRFDGIGACPLHFALCNKLIDGLREQRRNYAKQFGGRK